MQSHQFPTFPQREASNQNIGGDSTNEIHPLLHKSEDELTNRTQKSSRKSSKRTSKAETTTKSAKKKDETKKNGRNRLLKVLDLINYADTTTILSNEDAGVFGFVWVLLLVGLVGICGYQITVLIIGFLSEETGTSITYEKLDPTFLRKHFQMKICFPALDSDVDIYNKFLTKTGSDKIMRLAELLTIQNQMGSHMEETLMKFDSAMNDVSIKQLKVAINRTRRNGIKKDRYATSGFNSGEENDKLLWSATTTSNSIFITRGSALTSYTNNRPVLKMTSMANVLMATTSPTMNTTMDHQDIIVRNITFNSSTSEQVVIRKLTYTKDKIVVELIIYKGSIPVVVQANIKEEPNMTNEEVEQANKYQVVNERMKRTLAGHEMEPERAQKAVKELSNMLMQEHYRVKGEPTLMQGQGGIGRELCVRREKANLTLNVRHLAMWEKFEIKNKKYPQLRDAKFTFYGGEDENQLSSTHFVPMVKPMAHYIVEIKKFIYQNRKNQPCILAGDYLYPKGFAQSLCQGKCWNVASVEAYNCSKVKLNEKVDSSEKTKSICSFPSEMGNRTKSNELWQNYLKAYKKCTAAMKCEMQQFCTEYEINFKLIEPTPFYEHCFLDRKQTKINLQKCNNYFYMFVFQSRVEVFVEYFIYSIESVLSDSGGQLDLWVGLSVMELAKLVVYWLIKIKRLRGQRRALATKLMADAEVMETNFGRNDGSKIRDNKSANGTDVEMQQLSMKKASLPRPSLETQETTFSVTPK